MKLVKRFEVAAPPERVGSALCSEAFNVEAEEEREEVLSTKQVPVEETGRGRVFEVRSTEYKRKKTGGIDRSGTVQSVTRHTWDDSAKTLSWVYQGAGAKWVKVTGVYRLTPSGKGTLVVHDINIDVNIPVPLLGGAVAKLISREFDKAQDRFQRLLTKHALG